MAVFATPAVPITALLYQVTLFSVGAFVMRGAGCTINDMWDSDLDKKVDRTRDRPLASGQITHFQALVFLGAQLSVGLAVLLQLNLYSVLLGASSLALVITYPLMKRITYWPQAVLGLTFNWGALLGWSAVLGSCDWAVVGPLYAAGVCWTLVYDTIYALQDKTDDIKAGVKSTALRFEKNLTAWLSFFAVSFVGLLTIAGLNNAHGPIFFLVSVGGAAAHHIWTIAGLRPNDRVDAAMRFKASKWLGVFVFAGIVGDLVFKRVVNDENDRKLPI